LPCPDFFLTRFYTSLCVKYKASELAAAVVSLSLKILDLESASKEVKSFFG